MFSRINTAFFVSFVLLGAGCVHQGHGPVDGPRSVYKRDDGSSPSIAIYETGMAYIGTGRVDNPAGASRGGDLGAPVSDCSNERFRCFELGGSRLVVPRDSADDVWTYRDATCELVDSADWWKVTCERRGLSITFRYKADFGVTTFERAGNAYRYYSGTPILAPR